MICEKNDGLITKIMQRISLNTDKQLNFIKKLGGENLINTITTRQEASTLIDQLKGEGK